MSEEAKRSAREGFEAWQRGDFETVERMLDPAVTWHAFEPGEGDCQDREDVMTVVRERYEQGFVQGRLEFVDTDDDAIIVVAYRREIAGDDWPEETTTVIRFAEGRVVEMQDCRTLDEVRAAILRLRLNASRRWLCRPQEWAHLNACGHIASRGSQQDPARALLIRGGEGPHRAPRCLTCGESDG